MNEAEQLLDNLGGSQGIELVNIFSLLKFPLIILVFANLLFAFLLFLRIRILSETVKTPQNKLVKSLVVLYLLFTIVGTLISLLFVVLS